jgi:hypothetical protein
MPWKNLKNLKSYRVLIEHDRAAAISMYGCVPPPEFRVAMQE